MPPPPISPPPVPLAAPVVPLPDAPSGVIEPAALANLRSLDPTGASRLLERVLVAFETLLARLGPQLDAARASGDAETVKHVAHTLKSSSASVGAIKLSRLCAEMEIMIGNGACPDLDAAVRTLETEIALVLPAMRKALKTGS